MRKKTWERKEIVTQSSKHQQCHPNPDCQRPMDHFLSIQSPGSTLVLFLPQHLLLHLFGSQSSQALLCDVLLFYLWESHARSCGTSLSGNPMCLCLRWGHYNDVCNLWICGRCNTPGHVVDNCPINLLIQPDTHSTYGGTYVDNDDLNTLVDDN